MERLVTRWRNRFSPADGLCDLLRLSIYEGKFVPTSELRGWISISVELCPMPLGMPAVRYMAPTTRFFLASLAVFISSTVTPSSAKLWTPALAGAPSSHSRKWRLWLTAKERKESEERGDDRSKMLIHWNAYQCQRSTTEPQPDDEIISTSGACMYFYGSFLLPALKHLILKELPTCMSLAILQGYSYIFSPSITEETTTLLPGGRSGTQIGSQMVDKIINS